MRTEGSGAFLEGRRRLAVAQVLLLEETAADVAEALGVHVTSVRRWIRAFAQGGEAALAPAPVPGRPRKLGEAQAQRVLFWITCDARRFGFASDWWTAPRLAQVIQQRLGVQLHPRYLNDWLTRHGISPQVPGLSPRERDYAAIGRWFVHIWPAIKKGRPRPEQPSSLPMKAGC